MWVIMHHPPVYMSCCPAVDAICERYNCESVGLQVKKVESITLPQANASFLAPTLAAWNLNSWCARSCGVTPREILNAG